ncbi:class I SAM-dependent methyltransferase [Limnohabitans sp. yimb22184]|uniref:class I SAM-dependent methyltransferase n=1 Tax=Limnohabitans sp. YIMB22184 TaxID=3374104 RepID=UPI003A87B20D
MSNTSNVQTPVSFTDLHNSADVALASLLAARSKHSAYQELHPWVRHLLGEGASPRGKSEEARLAHMQAQLPFAGRRVLDIGANTGYFSFGALEHGSANVHAVEGNREHAAFMTQAAQLLDLGEQLEVEHGYFDFSEQSLWNHDLVLCLNVLHHLGDDFGAHGQDIVSAKQAMGFDLRRLASHAEHCWFQLGFNWKGDRHKPLFEHGLKSELIDFVAQACENTWSVEQVAIFNPQSGQYEHCTDALLQRVDELGEFLNRPLFLLKRKIF